MNDSVSILTRPTGYVRPSADLAIRAREFVARWGERVAVKAFGISSATLGRVCAGFTVQGLVLRAVEDGLFMSEVELEVIAASAPARRKGTP